MKKLQLTFLSLMFGLMISCSTAQTPDNSKATTPSEKPQKSSLEYMREGSAEFITGAYAKAIGPFQKALDLEKQVPKLERISGSL